MSIETGRRKLLVVGLLICALSACSSCLDEDRLDQSVERALRQTFDRLDATVASLGATIDTQRARLAGDTQAVLDTTLAGLQGVTSQFQQSLDAVLAGGRNVQETITAELQHGMTNLSGLAEGLLVAVKAGADDTIRNLVKDFERQRTATLRQLNGLVQGALRPTIAQLTLVGDHFVGRVTSAVNVWILRGAGGAVLIVALVSLLLMASKKGTARVVLAAVGGLALLTGGALLVLAPQIARQGAAELSIPSGHAVCQRMMTSSAALQAAAAASPTTPATPPLARVGDTLVDRRAVVGARLRERLQTPALRLGDDVRARRPTPPTLGGAIGKAASIPELAKAALEDASECITYATNGPMFDLASARFTIALAFLSDTLTCREPADCAPIGKHCDVALGVCLAHGVYCDEHTDCDLSKACLNHRCVARGVVPCATFTSCHPDDSCDPGSGRCIPTAEVLARHQACLVSGQIGPCATGELRPVDRMVRCVQTTLARPEDCDGLDNNCNGTIDEGLATADRCVAPGALGECANGRRLCSGGAWTCQALTASVEVCDGKDNDCDGQVDEGQATGEACTVAGGVGQCRSGTMGCRNGRRECVAPAPAPEVCDGKDNNCNGACDEGETCGEEEVFNQLDERHTLFGLREEHEYGDACGKDTFGRQRIRTRCEAKDEWERAQSHCEPYDTGFGGWTSSDNTSCRCKVHFGSRGDAHVRCRIKLYARPVGCIGGS